ncbi:patatin-like phospholipase [Arenibacter algicola]|uniref:Patatin-like phospholipase n=1 Tax=Arenibacter algicola TaxID=616991 RepID=A0ABY3AGG6_9FLAO
MENSERIKVLTSLLNDFHRKVKVKWASTDEYKIKGKEWLQSIHEKYDDLILDNWAQDTLLTETFHFLEISNKSQAENKQSDLILIMKGGGIKGLSYVGALEELQKYYDFNWFSGTSAGAITAVLLAAGYTNSELKVILEEKNFSDFKDASLLKALINLKNKGGLYEANTFTSWLEHLLSKKLDSATEIKLSHLPYRITICASRKNKSALLFDSTDEEYRNKNAAFATRCSMSIPIIFTPQKEEGLNIFDGGLQNNFPVEVILKRNPNADFIGLYLGPEIYETPKNSILKDPFSIWMDSSEAEILETYKDKIVVIDTRPISTLKFKLNKNEKDFLLENGRLAALKFLDKKGLIDKNQFNYEERKDALTTEKERLVNKKKRIRRLVKTTLITLAILTTGLYYFDYF